MAIGEFELIRKYFARPELSGVQGKHTDGIRAGIGDDCALLNIPNGMLLAQSMDTLVESVHFPVGSQPNHLGYRALAVNLSDLAAMGAEPHSFTLGLTLPEVNEDWLKGFSEGMARLAQQSGIALIGGDTTRGPMSLTLQVQGLVHKEQTLLRSGAKPGDLICVTGTLGDAAGALTYVLAGEQPDTCEDDSIRYLLTRYWYPAPRLYAGQWLGKKGATAALDISDGLLGDLGHILMASGVGAVIDPDIIPRSATLNRQFGKDKAINLALTGGDDYELCFTIPQDVAATMPSILPDGTRITCIGQVTEDTGTILNVAGETLTAESYTHF